MTTFRFCRDCNNMLYPREDKENNRLLFECRTCSYVEEAGSPLVYRHELITNIGETAGVVQDIGSDPTLPRSDRECPKCHSRENVFFQSQQRRKDTSMVLFFVCLSCSHIFTSDQKQKDAVFMSAQRTFKINDRERKWDLSSRMSCMYEKSTTIYTSLIYRQKDDVK